MPILYSLEVVSVTTSVCDGGMILCNEQKKLEMWRIDEEDVLLIYSTAALIRQ